MAGMKQPGEGSIFGIPVRPDEAVPDGVITMNLATWRALVAAIDAAKEDIVNRSKEAIENVRSGHLRTIKELEAQIGRLER